MGITSIRIQPEISKQLEKAATHLHRSKNSIINQAIKEFLQHQRQEQQRWQDTLAALESVRSKQLISEDSVHTWIESWGDSQELPVPKINS